jgi:hypothetical protein
MSWTIQALVESIGAVVFGTLGVCWVMNDELMRRVGAFGGGAPAGTGRLIAVTIDAAEAGGAYHAIET